MEFMGPTVLTEPPNGNSPKRGRWQLLACLAESRSRSVQCKAPKQAKAQAPDHVERACTESASARISLLKCSLLNQVEGMPASP